MNDWPRHSFRLNIISTSPSHVHKKQLTLSVGVNKSKMPMMSKATSKTLSTSKMSSTLNNLSKSFTVNKERNKRRKGSGYVSKKDNKKKAAKPKPASSQKDVVSSLDGK